MNFPSIDIQGSILSTDLLSKIRSEQATFQSGKDFRPDFTNPKLKDEISFAWQEAKGQWTIYKSKLARLRSGELGTTETRNFWISPLLTNLGYNLTFNRQAEDLNGKSFSIGYRDTTLDGFPIYAGGYHESLDKRPENKQIRMSPHALVQEYLNYSEHLYGIVTNGRQLRLLRDASRITRLSYVEFNLEKMMEEDLYSDFVLLYRLLHASRMPRTVASGPDSIIEKYHQDGLQAGSTIRNKLGRAVKKAIQDLANAFINHPNNEELRDVVKANKLNLDEYYKLQLRIIYRLLFLFVIEERNLVYADSKTSETKRFNEIYFKHYSLIRLRRLAKKLAPPESHRHFDLWRSVVSTFSLFENKQVGEKLGIMSLQGDLFGYNSLTTSSYDLHECDVSNAVILQIIKSLTYFENEQGVLIAVNYGGLDVEEFGSVYEGLLELKLAIKNVEGTHAYSCTLDSSDERGTSGSHYTPEELVQPLIKHSLDYLIADKLKEKDAAKALLSLKIADITCGSGHILLSAARRIAHELASIIETKESGSKEKVEQPSPGYVRKAMKEVVRNCIYGVDKNPLAVELCKVALWLEAYNPGEPLNFLDHHVKCGDAIVGLAHRDELQNGISDAAFKTVSGDDKDLAKAFRDKNVKERKERETKGLQLKADFEKNTESTVQEAIAEYKSFNQLPESTPDEIERKAKAYKIFIDGKGFTFLKAMADTQVSQFFIAKTNANKDYLMTDGDFRMILSGYNKSWQDRRVAKATAVAAHEKLFHWFIEYPEVFETGGFDCILGNPPFLGGTMISGPNGKAYYEFITHRYVGASNRCDLSAYFMRRAFEIVKDRAYLSLIATNSISEGDTRAGGLENLLARNATINHAAKSIPWPGQAAVIVSLVSLFKGKEFLGKIELSGNRVDHINSFLDAGITESAPMPLQANANLGFNGSYVFGDGFLLGPQEAEQLLQSNELNAQVLFPYLNGDDLNSSFNQQASRWVINFGERTMQEARSYEKCFAIVETNVKAFRLSKSQDVAEFPWWQFWRARKSLYQKIAPLKRVLIHTRVTKTHGFSFVPTNMVYSDATVVIASDESSMLAVLQSSIHEAWAWKYSSKLKTDRRYSVEDCFQTFPLPHPGPNDLISLNELGEQYYQRRRILMERLKLGLTKTYNLFNQKDLNVAIIEKQSKQNHANCEKAYDEIIQMRELHIAMDESVLKAYGWQDVSLEHKFYDLDYLPETDKIRFTIHPHARKEILKRLLDLNHIRYKEESKGDIEGNKRPSSKNRKKSKVEEPESGYGSLFKGE
jgi:hypothetical protein